MQLKLTFFAAAVSKCVHLFKYYFSANFLKLTTLKYRLSRHVYTTSRPEDKREEDRSNDAECPKPVADQSERRRSFISLRIHLPP